MHAPGRRCGDQLEGSTSRSSAHVLSSVRVRLVYILGDMWHGADMDGARAYFGARVR